MIIKNSKCGLLVCSCRYYVVVPTDSSELELNTYKFIGFRFSCIRTQYCKTSEEEHYAAATSYNYYLCSYLLALLVKLNMYV